MRKLLFISYYFPPILSSESLRALRTVKYLPRCGWEPIVLTVFPTKLVARDFDNSLLSELPRKIPIYRAYSFKNMVSNFALREIRKLLGWSCLASYMIEWLPFALLKGKEVLEKETIEAIISRSTPFASHLVALKLKSLSGVPWIADFSDPWTQNPYLERVTALDESLERAVVLAADKIIFTNIYAKKLLLNKYKSIKEERVIVIPNQYDPEDFAKQEKVPASKVFTVVHTGNFYEARSPETFLKALRMLKDQEGFAEKIKVKLIGKVNHKLRCLISKYRLEDIVETIRTIPHKNVLHNLHTADILLLIDAPTDELSPFLPLKLVEYICVRKPILAITPLKGASGDVVRSTKTGIIISPNDINGIKDVIKRFYQQYENSELGIRPCWNEVKKYSANRCTGILAGILEELAD
ncbi:MAG: glycosyltransferase family 4 protein [Candidatus Bathyarchaeota archaeon]|nr:glycosyltransferase family 4 protein [Candidatus Bathyarchaeota archaeon]